MIQKYSDQFTNDFEEMLNKLDSLRERLDKNCITFETAEALRKELTICGASVDKILKSIPKNA